MTPSKTLKKWISAMKPEWKTAFFSAFLIGLMIHMPALVSDIPNHDGLSSMYFDQNMITSGRWFLTVACGFSSYYTIPWFIGILGLFFLSCAAVALTELLELKDGLVIGLISGLLAAFPALASTFAYVFTLDGYMMGLLLAVLSVLLVKKYRYGFLGGALCLAFSMGIYQSYLPFAILLSIYAILMLLIEEGESRQKFRKSLQYLYMGALGAVLYYLILNILLKLQHKELAAYQGINELGGESAGIAGFSEKIIAMYRDFASFTLKGNVLFHNVFSCAGLAVLTLLTLLTLVCLICRKKWWKNPFFFVIIILLALGLPLATNIVLFISPNVTYHLLMRYQWVLYPILMAAFVSRYGLSGEGSAAREQILSWLLGISVFVLVFCYGVADNIGYSNLQKRYEKTYAYCVRLLDRIEQTEGYYQGIPIAMVGVVGYVPYPETDITGDVTSGMIGLNGDFLLYTGSNYQEFMKHYLGATLNILSPEKMQDIYYSEEYIAMESFPAQSSVKIIDGVLCVKTENVGRD
ncbi:MAG: glucosyltransferase domain-containing protein [Bacteroidales bacterium]|nr:glucosyltransferase domain-containing protein [Lachnoclostridium sp.]MCM1383439.1 glucosyltransferase domain-containing protein [Lachnoclostridium sp.]MCM1464288.1 glucosyltransferase domain-containing protein [Bacteroidales bacterium]